MTDDYDPAAAAEAFLNRMVDEMQAAIDAHKAGNRPTWDEARLLSTPPDSERVDHISREMQPYLHGLHPGEQGAILADLLAIWLSGHPIQQHERLIDVHVRGVRRLVPLYIERRGDADDD